MFAGIAAFSSGLKIAVGVAVVVMVLTIAGLGWALSVKEAQVKDAHAARDAAQAQAVALGKDLEAERAFRLRETAARAAAEAKLAELEAARQQHSKALNDAITKAGEKDVSLQRCMAMRLPADVLQQLAH